MFTNRNDLLLTNPAQLNYGISVTDVDGDGAQELFVAGFGFPNLILKWNGTGFENIATEQLADAERSAIGVAACDIDGDGQEEIYVLNTDSFSGAKELTDRLFDFRDGVWIDIFEQPESDGLRNFIAGRSVACVDRTGNGRYGFFVANYGGPMILFEQTEEGQLINAAPALGLDQITGGRGLVSLPLISEHMDIFAANERGPNFLYQNQGDGRYIDVATSFGITDERQNGRGIAVLDANADGKFDIVYGNWEGPHRLFVQDGDRFVDMAPRAMAVPSRIRTVIAADFDNDGYEEIFFNNIGEPNRLFGYRPIPNASGREWVEIDIGAAQEAFGLGTGGAVGDFDGDGRLELMISHGESGAQPLSLYHTPDNGNGWLRVQPLTASGAPARGAIVRLIQGDRTQLRAIDAGSGYLCQMEPIAHFGLGQTLDTDAVEVRWPDGTVETIANPAANQLITVQYPSG